MRWWSCRWRWRSFVVAQRSREIGIRLALGTAPAGLIRMFVRQGLMLTAVGGAMGLVTAIALTQWMSSLLFGVGRLDPPTYAAVLRVLGLAAAMVSYVPARRADTQGDIATTLEREPRYESTSADWSSGSPQTTPDTVRTAVTTATILKTLSRDAAAARCSSG